MILTLEEIRQLIETPQVANLGRHKFDRTCLFLLDLRYDNLFIPIGRYDSAWWWRCKGCNAEVKRNKREEHHHWHKKELT